MSSSSSEYDDSDGLDDDSDDPRLLLDSELDELTKELEPDESSFSSFSLITLGNARFFSIADPFLAEPMILSSK
jgi:hypothetical protein